MTRADFNNVYEKWNGRPLIKTDWQSLDLTVQKQSFKGDSWCGAVTFFPEDPGMYNYMKLLHVVWIGAYREGI